MPVDRGELRYGITVEDNFSSGLKKFRDELAASKAAWEDLKKAQAASTGTDLSTDIRAAEVALKSFTQNIQNNILAFQQNNNTTTTFNQNIRNYAPAVRQAAQATQDGTQQILAFGRALGLSTGQASAFVAVLGPIGIAVAALAAGVAGAAVVLKAAATDAVNLNEAMETAGRGIAAVVLATGQISDASGKAATGARAMNLAFTEGQRQAALLRKEMIDTSVTYADLEAAFKQSIGPGLASGLNIDQIRKFSEALTQAAAVLRPGGGGGAGALAREQEQIFAGNISGKNLLANALGIDNQTLASAREAGTLVQLLTDKLQSFGDVSKESGSTLDGSLSRFQNLIERILQEGGVDLFNSIKGLVSDIFQLVKDNEPQITGFFTRTFALVAALVESTRGYVTVLSGLINIAKLALSGDFLAAAAQASKPLAGLDIAKLVQDAVNASRNLDTALNGPTTKTKTLAEQIASLPPNIQAATVSFEKESQVIAKLQQDLRKAQEGVFAGPQGFGGQSTADRANSNERRVQLEEEFKATEALRELKARQKNAENDLAVALNEQSVLQATIVQQGGATNAEVLRQVQLQGAVVVASRTIAQAKAEELKVNTLVNDTIAIRVTDLAQKEIRSLQQQLPLLDAQAKGAVAVADAKARALTGRGADTEVALAQAQATLIEAQAKAQQDLLKATNEERSARAAIADAEQRDPTGAESVTLEKQLGLEIQKNADLREQNNAKIKVAQAEVTHLLDIQNNPITTGAVDAFKKYGDLATLEYQATVNTLQGMTTQFAAFAGEAIASIFDPKKRADLPAAFGRLLTGIANQIITQVSQLVIGKIVNAALSLFQDVPKEVSQAANTVALTANTASLVGLTTAIGILTGALAFNSVAVVEGGALGAAGAAGSAGGSAAASIGVAAALAAAAAFATGGPVLGGTGFATAAHFGPRARGFADGGRPSGLPASDIVPAWLTPGEWVMRLGAVQRYGADVMNAINEGLVDPTSLRALAGPVSGAVRAPRGPGFAAGGLISDQLLVARNSSSGGGGGASVVRTAVVPDEQSFERMIRGGKGALLRFFQDNAGTIRSALGQGGGA